MTNYVALKNEIAGQAYAGMTDAQIIAAVNAKTVPGPKRDVPMGSVSGYLALRLKLHALQDYSKGTPTPDNGEAIAAARTFFLLTESPKTAVFQTSDPAIFQGVNNLLLVLAADSESGITSDDVAAIMALADSALPWLPLKVGIASATQADLDAARAS